MDDKQIKKMRKRAFEKTKSGHSVIITKGGQKELAKKMIDATIKEQYGSEKNLRGKLKEPTYEEEQKLLDMKSKFNQKARKWMREKVEETDDPQIKKQYEKLKKLRSKRKLEA